MFDIASSSSMTIVSIPEYMTDLPSVFLFSLRILSCPQLSYPREIAHFQETMW